MKEANTYIGKSFHDSINTYIGKYSHDSESTEKKLETSSPKSSTHEEKDKTTDKHKIDKDNLSPKKKTQAVNLSPNFKSMEI